MEEEFSIFVSVDSGLIFGDLLCYALTFRSCCRRFHRQESNGLIDCRGQGPGKKYYPKSNVGWRFFFYWFIYPCSAAIGNQPMLPSPSMKRTTRSMVRRHINTDHRNDDLLWTGTKRFLGGRGAFSRKRKPPQTRPRGKDRSCSVDRCATRHL